VVTSARPRLNTTRLQRKHVNDNDDNSFMVKTARQVFTSIIIIVLVFAISKINVPVCKNLIASIENTLTYTVDYKKAASDIIEGVKKIPSLFSRESQDNPPVQESEAAQDEAIATVEENADAQTD
jgi:hypothetical protein